MKVLDFLDNPVVWESNRVVLNWLFGLYSKREKLLKEFGVLANDPSVLDIGCGIGQYSRLTKGNYLGVDLNERYINYATKKHKRANETFRSANVEHLLKENHRFDVVIMVDFLHHIPDQTCVELLRTAQKMAGRYVVSFEPVTEQSHPLGKWIVDNDRGDHVRPLNDLQRLFEIAEIPISKSLPLRLGPINTRVILCKMPVPAEKGHATNQGVMN
jgi:SAM-dependent methyltransferase